MTTTSTCNKYCGDWTNDVITAIHTYTYSTWKERNNILHKHATKSTRALTKQALQDRIVTLYKQGRVNLNNYKLRYFKLPVEQRQKKGIENIQLWITLVETNFRKRGQATQVKMDTWLTQTTPERMWRNRLKSQPKEASNHLEGRNRIS